MSELNVFTKELKRRKLELLETCKIVTFKNKNEYIIIPDSGPILLKAFKKAEPKIA